MRANNNHLTKTLATHFLWALFILCITLVSCSREDTSITSTVGTENVFTATITDASGTPLPNAEVTLYPYPAPVIAAKQNIEINTPSQSIVNPTDTIMGTTDLNGQFSETVFSQVFYFMVTTWSSENQILSQWTDSINESTQMHAVISLLPSTTLTLSFEAAILPTDDISLRFDNTPLEFSTPSQGVLTIPSIPQDTYTFSLTMPSTAAFATYTFNDVLFNEIIHLPDTLNLDTLKTMSTTCLDNSFIITNAGAALCQDSSSQNATSSSLSSSSVLRSSSSFISSSALSSSLFLTSSSTLSSSIPLFSSISADSISSSSSIPFISSSITDSLSSTSLADTLSSSSLADSLSSSYSSSSSYLSSIAMISSAGDSI